MLLSIIVLIVVGLFAGGIVNILADDLPHYRWPRSPRYPDGTPRPVSAWLGTLAFLTGKRTSPGGSKLSWRYPLAELGTVALLLLSLAARQVRGDVSDTQFVFWVFYMAIFMLITVIDIEHKLILFSVIIPSCVIAILDALLTPTLREPGIRDALIGGAVGFGVFFLMYLGGMLYIYITNTIQGRIIDEVAFGYGDVMMATLSGLILGWQALIFAMFITVILGALGALLFLLSRKLSRRGYSMFTALPYGPYIVAGTLLMLLFGAQVRYLIVGY
jgi:prepilin signal peptidase PulO-like enzyme (type II secretory pathway)